MPTLVVFLLELLLKFMLLLLFAMLLLPFCYRLFCTGAAVVICDNVVDAKSMSENTQRAVTFTKCQKQSQSYCQHDLSQHTD